MAVAKPKRVHVVYRNYIPLYSGYKSFETKPPRGLEFCVPPSRPLLRKGYGIYRQYSNSPLIKLGVRVAQKLLFNGPSRAPADIDAFFYVGILPQKVPDRPFVIDLEHSFALCNFVMPQDLSAVRERCLEILTNKKCLAILPWSQAAQKNVELFFGQKFSCIASKTHVMYPALEARTPRQEPPREAGRAKRVLFIGKEARRKGLDILLDAFERVSAEFQNVELTVISELPEDLARRCEGMRGVTLLKPAFSLTRLYSEFFETHDLFVLPTLQDTFGMVFVEAMSAGLPSLSTKVFATPEIIDDMRSGLLLEHPSLEFDKNLFPVTYSDESYGLSKSVRGQIVDDLAKKMLRFLGDDELQKVMRAKCREAFSPGGKFSVDDRNKQLESIFETLS